MDRGAWHATVHGVAKSRTGKELNTTERLHFHFLFMQMLGFHCGSNSKESTCNAGDLGLIPRLGRSPGEGNGNPFQHSCLENSMDRGAWQATVHGITKSQIELNN